MQAPNESIKTSIGYKDNLEADPYWIRQSQ